MSSFEYFTHCGLEFSHTPPFIFTRLKNNLLTKLPFWPNSAALKLFAEQSNFRVYRQSHPSRRGRLQQFPVIGGNSFLCGRRVIIRGSLISFCNLVKLQGFATNFGGVQIPTQSQASQKSEVPTQHLLLAHRPPNAGWQHSYSPFGSAKSGLTTRGHRSGLEGALVINILIPSTCN